MIKYLLLALSILSVTFSFSQDLVLNGTVSGYSYNPNHGLLSKGGDVSLEGTLDGVSLHLIKNGKSIKKVTSNENGSFDLNLPFGATYNILYSKNGYEKVNFEFNLSNLKSTDPNLYFNHFELILNKHIQYKSNANLGLAFQIFYNPKILNFDIEKKGFKTGGKLSKKMDYMPLTSLVKESIRKNKSQLFSSKKSPEVSNKKKRNITKINTTKDTLLTNDLDTSILTSKKVVTLFLNNTSIKSKTSLIDELKKQLELDKLTATTAEDSALINERETLILALSSELELSKELITSKEEQLQVKSRQFWLLILVLILALGIGAYIFLSMRKKEQLNLQIIDQGNRIVSSINYAEKIQSAILPSIDSVKEVLPNSFILFKPKDIVSGDFYWTKEIEGKILVAAIDCTGHGVPGAFMSMIGMTLLNQIVLIDKNLNPKSILEELHKSIVTSLKQNESDPFSSQDGMDLSIAVFDKKTSELTYAGAMNSIFMVSNDIITELDVDKTSVGGFSFKEGGHKYTNKTIKIESNESLYLMSDGVMDQFGGEQNEKFNLTRLEELLLSVAKKPMLIQKSLIEKALLNWQGSQPQTDDMLLIGLSFNN
jgi:serine phosphatase RsbU (regulator of sigma subunit)